MQATAPQLDGDRQSLQEKLAAVNRLIAQTEQLIGAQEQEVAKLKAAGLDARHAEGLLDAYRASARIASAEKRQLEEEIARCSS